MNDTDRELIEETLRISKENNQMLKSLRRFQHWSTFWSIVKIVVFVLPFILGYFYLKPYFGDMSSMGSSLSSFKDVLNAYK